MGKHRILRCRVVAAHPQHGGGPIPCPGPAHAQAGGRSAFQVQKSGGIAGLLHQVLLPQIYLGDILQAAAAAGGALRLHGMVVRPLHLGRGGLTRQLHNHALY